MFDFKKRKLDSFWRVLFSNNGLMVNRLFQILFLKFQYVSLSQNPSMYACESLIYILRAHKVSPYAKMYSKQLSAIVRHHFQLYSFHMFELAKTRFLNGKFKQQGYTLAACLSYEAKTHLELLFLMMEFQPELMRKVDSYLFQVVFYWMMQAL